MGKKVLSAGERSRVRQAAEQRRKEKEMKQYTTLLIALVCVIAVIGLVMVMKNAFTQPKEIRSLNAVEDSWIVIDADNTTGTRYHHPASFVVPAGYHATDFTLMTDDVQRDFYVEADDENAVVESVYVCAAPELTAAEYMQRLVDYSPAALNEGDTVETGEPFTATIAGKEAHCLYLAYTSAAEDGTMQAYGCLYTAFDAPKNVCVYASVSGGYTTPESIQTVETLLAEAETLLAGLTIMK